MRLYLSSYRLGDRGGSLLALLGNGKRAAVVENGQDHLDSAERQRRRPELHDPHAELAGLGIEARPLDLRDYFGQPASLAAELAGFDMVWVTGGNAFVLRRAMQQSGFDGLIVDLLDRDAIVYGGYSAGAVVAGPSLAGIDCIDDPLLAPPGYQPAPVWDGLGLIDFTIVPHYRSPHPETAAAERATRQLSARGLRYRPLRDGEVVVWTEQRMRLPQPALRIA
ncbi:MAG TPA: Type 1 glutamine amidotransferase-like domain-containing protein [Devosiaceae bacterium]|jgi:dipeptidase E|nr:Type 1 glutamine amidotransferase-like domain-containing protein [Devosiaceae bacterium]